MWPPLCPPFPYYISPYADFFTLGLLKCITPPIWRNLSPNPAFELLRRIEPAWLWLSPINLPRISLLSHQMPPTIDPTNQRERAAAGNPQRPARRCLRSRRRRIQRVSARDGHSTADWLACSTVFSPLSGMCQRWFHLFLSPLVVVQTDNHTQHGRHVEKKNCTL